MHIHLPKPLHGWRAFVGEVGIIVIGVLIALGAEQIVEAAHWRSELSKFRGALDQEVALNLAFYDYRIGQRQCLNRRIADLSRWAGLQRSGRNVVLAGEIGRPSIATFNYSVWRSRGVDITQHMPIGTELDYADIYDSFDSLNLQLVEERDAWRSLAAFNGANHLSPDNLMRLTELIYRVKSLDRAIDEGNGRGLRFDAKKLGLKPDWRGYRTKPDADFCKPLLPGTIQT